MLSKYKHTPTQGLEITSSSDTKNIKIILREKYTLMSSSYMPLYLSLPLHCLSLTNTK